jgi:hypothetical protein
MIRPDWNGWLELVTRAERFPPPHDPLLCFAIAWLSFEEGQDRRYRVVLGEHHEINRALAGEAIHTVNFVSIACLLHHLRVNAQRANIGLPEKLTIAQDEPGFKEWRREIELYPEAAGARVAKAKPLTPA